MGQLVAAGADQFLGLISVLAAGRRDVEEYVVEIDAQDHVRDVFGQKPITLLAYGDGLQRPLLIGDINHDAENGGDDAALASLADRPPFQEANLAVPPHDPGAATVALPR